MGKRLWLKQRSTSQKKKWLFIGHLPGREKRKTELLAFADFLDHLEMPE
jgi:hypothetical protein